MDFIDRPVVLRVEESNYPEALGECLVRDNVNIHTACGDGATSHRLEVVRVGVDVESGGTTVAGAVVGANTDGDLVGGPDAVISGAGGDPVLGGSVVEAEFGGRETGDGIGTVGDAVVAAGLAADVAGEDGVANTGGAIGVDVDGLERAVRRWAPAMVPTAPPRECPVTTTL